MELRSGLAPEFGADLAAGHDATTDIGDLMRHLIEVDGSDLHLRAGAPPMVRVHGEVIPVPGRSKLSPADVEALILPTMTPQQRHEFEQNADLDYAYPLPGVSRFRVNVMRQRGSMGAVFRAIPWQVASLEELGMPDVVAGFAALPRGLILVTGPTGCGKSTTLAALVDLANQTRRGHIITIEDPIEYTHTHGLSLVSQREVGSDTASFAAGLRHALRQDPDIILVGEMRDYETMGIALTAADTGHLVLGTLHTSSAEESVTRIVDATPPGSKEEVRSQLASSLRAVVTQTLCRTADGHGRVAAVEILIATPGIRSQIREGKISQISSAMQSGASVGMVTLDQSLASLVRSGRIALATAIQECREPAELAGVLGYHSSSDMVAASRSAPHPSLGMGAIPRQHS